MQREFVESMKTIAQSAVERAGFDKTRNGKIVGVNSITNTYSVKVDGIVYNNVKTVNDITCNKGDTVKVNIPMNNPSQAYITSSVLSDDSIGSKLAVVDEAIDQIDNKIDGIVEIMNSIYQLSISVAYDNDPNNVGYKLVTYTALLTQDGVNVTDTHDPSEFRWYLEKTEGQQEISGSPARSVRLSTKDYFYGQAIMLEWTYTYTDPISEETKTAQLRSRVTLISNDAITQVAKYTTEVTSGGVFVHRADGNYDVGADWQSVWAYGVKISNTVDIIKGGQIYGSFGGSYLTIGHTSYKNIYISNDTFIQFRDGSTVLTDIRPGSITLGRTASSYYNAYMDTQSLNFRQGTTILGQITANAITLGRTSTYNTYITTGGVDLRYGTTNLASFTTSGITLRNSSGYVTFTAGANAMNLYTGTATNVALASFTTSGLTLRNSSGTECMYVTSSSLRVGDIGFWSRNTGGLLGMYIAGTGGYGDDMNLYVSGHTGYLEASNGTLHLGSSASEVVLGTNGDLFRPSDDNTTNLGTSSYRWKKVYAASSSISTSDRKEKDVLGNIDFAYDLIMSLQPIHYMWKKGDHNRTWMGFIAQDIAKWCNERNLNLGLYTASYKDEEEDDGHHDGYHGEEVDDNLLNWGLAYEELIAPLIKVVQDQQKNIDNLKRRLSQLEQKE